MTFSQSCFKKQPWLFVVFLISPWCSMMPLHLQRPWHNYFLQPGQVAQTSAQSIFLRCLCRKKPTSVCLPRHLGRLDNKSINIFPISQEQRSWTSFLFLLPWLVREPRIFCGLFSLTLPLSYRLDKIRLYSKRHQELQSY